MIWCLSNARSGDLHFGISFVALRALVREIIPNTIHTNPHTRPNSEFHRLFDSGFAPSALSLSLNKFLGLDLGPHRIPDENCGIGSTDLRKSWIQEDPSLI